MLSRLILSSARRYPRLAVQIKQVRCSSHGHELENVPPQFKNITYNDVPLPRGMLVINQQRLILIFYLLIIFKSQVAGKHVMMNYNPNIINS